MSTSRGVLLVREHQLKSATRDLRIKIPFDILNEPNGMRNVYVVKHGIAVVFGRRLGTLPSRVFARQYPFIPRPIRKR